MFLGTDVKKCPASREMNKTFGFLGKNLELRTYGFFAFPAASLWSNRAEALSVFDFAKKDLEGNERNLIGN